MAPVMATVPSDAGASVCAPQGGVIRPTKLFIGGISRRTTTKQLRDHFSKRGRVLDCVAMRQPDGRPRGFAYVTLDSPVAAEYFLQEPQVIDNRIVDLKPAVRDTSSSLGGGTRGGGFGNSMHEHHWNVPQHVAGAQLSQHAPYYMGNDHFGLYGGTGIGGGKSMTPPGSFTMPGFDATQQCWLDSHIFDNSPHNLLCDYMRALPSVGMMPATSSVPRHVTPTTLSPPAAPATSVLGEVVPRHVTPTTLSPPVAPATSVLGEVTNLLDNGGARLGTDNQLKPRETSINMGGMDKSSKFSSLTMEFMPLSKRVTEDEGFFVKEDSEDDSPTTGHMKPLSSTASRDSSPQKIPISPCNARSLPSVGSANHASGECKRCNFFARDCCRNGSDCLFCHYPHERRSRQAKREANPSQLVAQQQQQEDGQMSDASSSEDISPVCANLDMLTSDTTRVYGEGIGLISPLPPPRLLPAPGLPLPPHLAMLSRQSTPTAVPCQVPAAFGPQLASGSQAAMTARREMRSVGTQTDPDVACPECGQMVTF